MTSLFSSPSPPRQQQINIPTPPAIEPPPKPEPVKPKYRQSAEGALGHVYSIFKEFGLGENEVDYGTKIQPLTNKLYSGEIEEDAVRSEAMGMDRARRDAKLEADRLSAEEAHDKRMAELKQPTPDAAPVQQALSESTRRRAKQRGHKATILASRMMGDMGGLNTTLGS